jgi:small acid-soluble spore protein (thioredoxin-like protein)
MNVKSKPDDRRDNVKKIQRNINRTIQNMEAADDMIARTDDPKMKQALAEKNERRRAGLDGMRAEIRDEAEHQKKTEP